MSEQIQQALRNLMARINRDGGHRAAEIGDDIAAAKECEAKWCDLITENERLRAGIEELQSIASDGLQSVGILSRAGQCFTKIKIGCQELLKGGEDE